MLHDIRYALRTLAKSPGFAAVAILTLALGIGATTSTFSVVSAVLLKPLPYHEPERLVQLWETNPIKGWTQATVAPANLLDWQKQNHVFTDMAAYSGADGKGATLSDFYFTGSAEPIKLRGLRVTGNLFSVLGVNPLLGRTFLPEETWKGTPPVLILSHALWQRQFGGDPNIIGRTIALSGEKLTVVGVMPPDFYFPIRKAELWVPFGWDAGQMASYRRPHFLRVISRLRPDVSLEKARAEMQTIASRLEQQYPVTNTKMGVGLGPAHDWVVSDTRYALMLFLAAVGLVLLVACVNVANLLLARASSRTREFAVRSALGAARSRLIRQLLTESLLLATVGGALGIVVALWSKDFLLALKPGNIPRLDEVALDWRVLMFTLGVTALTSLLFGLAPAFTAARTDLAAALERSGGRGSAGIEGGLARNSLVVAEIALALILVTGAGLLLRSFRQLQSVDPGFNANKVLTFRVSLPGSTYAKEIDVSTFFERLIDRIRLLPGVQSAAATGRLGLKGYEWTSDFSIENRPPGEFGPEVLHKEITPDYFHTMGIPRLAGREFTKADQQKSEPVVIVNEALVRRYGAGENLIGRRLKFERPEREGKWRTIVGIVKDEKQEGLSAAVRPEIYQALPQNANDDMTVVVRTAMDPMALVGPVRNELRALDKNIAPDDIQTMDTVVYESVSRERFAMLLAAVFAGLAALLAAVGIYGVMSYAVSRRTGEIGIRVAMGAQPRDIFRMVIRRAVVLAAAGVAIGIAGALALTRLLTNLLFGVSASDPATYTVVALAVSALVLAASYFPARRATRVDPMVALRYE